MSGSRRPSHDLIFTTSTSPARQILFASAATGPGTYNITISELRLPRHPRKPRINIANPPDHDWTSPTHLHPHRRLRHLHLGLQRHDQPLHHHRHRLEPRHHLGHPRHLRQRPRQHHRLQRLLQHPRRPSHLDPLPRRPRLRQHHPRHRLRHRLLRLRHRRRPPRHQLRLRQPPLEHQRLRLLLLKPNRPARQPPHRQLRPRQQHLLLQQRQRSRQRLRNPRRRQHHPRQQHLHRQLRQRLPRLPHLHRKQQRLVRRHQQHPERDRRPARQPGPLGGCGAHSCDRIGRGRRRHDAASTGSATSLPVTEPRCTTAAPGPTRAPARRSRHHGSRRDLDAAAGRPPRDRRAPAASQARPVPPACAEPRAPRAPRVPRGFGRHGCRRARPARGTTGRVHAAGQGSTDQAG